MKLIATQPIVRKSTIIKKFGSGCIENDIIANIEVHVVNYHILASDMDEAISIAIDNHEFEYLPSANIEIRPINKKKVEPVLRIPKISIESSK